MWKEAGTYDPAKVYARLDWVRFNGCSWICGANQKAPSAPPGADWSLIAQKATGFGAMLRREIAMAVEKALR
jgi:hypothetical protein